MSCARRRDPGVKVAGPPRRTAQEGTRGCTHAAGQSEQEVPTMVHGMRCPARLTPWRVAGGWAVEGMVLS
jgi:hypothetical protein